MTDGVLFDLQGLTCEELLHLLGAHSPPLLPSSGGNLTCNVLKLLSVAKLVLISASNEPPSQHRHAHLGSVT